MRPAAVRIALPEPALRGRPVFDQRDLAGIAGHFHTGTLERCFPDGMQLPPLGSTTLQTLQGDLKLTTNRAVTHGSSGSARTDLFFKFKAPDSLDQNSNEKLDRLLQQVTYAVTLSAAVAMFSFQSDLPEQCAKPDCSG